jgi:hypothetical protein
MGKKKCDECTELRIKLGDSERELVRLRQVRRAGRCTYCRAVIIEGEGWDGKTPERLLAHVRVCPMNQFRQMIHALAVADHADGTRRFCRLCLVVWNRMEHERHGENCPAGLILAIADDLFLAV